MSRYLVFSKRMLRHLTGVDSNPGRSFRWDLVRSRHSIVMSAIRGGTRRVVGRKKMRQESAASCVIHQSAPALSVLTTATVGDKPTPPPPPRAVLLRQPQTRKHLEHLRLGLIPTPQTQLSRMIFAGDALPGTSFIVAPVRKWINAADLWRKG